MTDSDLTQGHASIPELILHDGKEQLRAADIVRKWLSRLSQAFRNGDFASQVPGLFLEDSWWRDMVCLSWDVTSKRGVQSISDYLESTKLKLEELELVEDGPLVPQLVELGPLIFIQGLFTFKTAVGLGRGVLRLTNTQPGRWQAWTVYTQLEKWTLGKGLKRERKAGDEHANLDVGAQTDPPNDNEWQVLVVGAGQSGIMLGAHFQNLGIKCLVIDQAEAIGHSWLERLDSLKIHSPIESDHYPFLEYPSDWPSWPSRSDVVSWMEHYVQAMSLNLQLDTAVRRVQYFPEQKRYAVEVFDKRGVTRTLRAKHFIQATGLLSKVPYRPTFPGEDSFRGTMLHSSSYKSGKDFSDLKNKKIFVIGCGTNAHDVAKDLIDNGAASVSMLQRRPTFVASMEASKTLQYQPWTSGLTVEDGDLIGNSFPTPIVRTMGVGLSAAMAHHDQELLSKLENAGFGIKRGENGTSIIDHALIRAGSFYIDQGACDMIIDGRIKVYRCEGGIQEIKETSVRLSDGQEIEADLIIICTGFKRMSHDVRSLMGDEVADKVGGDSFGMLDDVQERIGLWRPTGYPGYWFMTGSFLWSRQFAPFLAFQIKAIEEGINQDYYRSQKVE